MSRNLRLSVSVEFCSGRLPLPSSRPAAPTEALNCSNCNRRKSKNAAACRSRTAWPASFNWPSRTRRKPLAIGCRRLPRTSNCKSALPCCHSSSPPARAPRKIRPSLRLDSRNSRPGARGLSGNEPARSMLLLDWPPRRARSSRSLPPSRAREPFSRLRALSRNSPPVRANCRDSWGLPWPSCQRPVAPRLPRRLAGTGVSRAISPRGKPAKLKLPSPWPRGPWIWAVNGANCSTWSRSWPSNHRWPLVAPLSCRLRGLAPRNSKSASSLPCSWPRGSRRCSALAWRRACR